MLTWDENKSMVLSIKNLVENFINSKEHNDKLVNIEHVYSKVELTGRENLTVLINNIVTKENNFIFLSVTDDGEQVLLTLDSGVQVVVNNTETFMHHFRINVKNMERL